MEKNNNRIRKRKLSTEEIINLYNKGDSTTEIGKLANVSARYVNQLLKENNVERRSRGSWKRKYQLNEHYFKTWSNNMAYILGFFIADGTVAAHGSQSISISQKEKYILENIKKEIGTKQPLYQNKKTGVYILNLNSKIMKEDIMNIHGIMPNKSATVEFPKVPEKYMSHFIRGYFDGDGFVKYKKYFVSFVGGSELFMISLKKEIEQRGFETNFTKHDTYFRVYVSGRKTIKLFSDWMYKDKDEGLYLKRKFNEFQLETLPDDKLKDRGIKTHKNALRERQIKNNNIR
ncbi:endonuclease [Virgibacillus indicus]|uniref:Endonuclease n=1 Tax=Virgibacillus indicus TaxID=2024554 RepID=A0A265NDQ4_9BACI|nr:LAGLIDADG family homing endonuclease [Virgibacillus indicus]OZU90180.1 endonuclease [Virgibacillus indicus]